MKNQQKEDSSFTPSKRKQAQEGGYSLIDGEALRERLSDESIAIVDVRDAETYEQGHIPGAICYSLPLTWQARLFKRWWLKKLLCQTSCRGVVFYCDGPHSMRSDSASRAAVISGFPEVANYAGGMEDWEARGYPIETGSCCEPEENV